MGGFNWLYLGSYITLVACCLVLYVRAKRRERRDRFVSDMIGGRHRSAAAELQRILKEKRR